MQPWDQTTLVGKPIPRVDGYERVSGGAVYTVDVSFPDMLHLAILRCPHAHALVKSVEAAAARAMPGVRAVLTPADPEASLVLPYPNWIPSGPPMRLLDTHCRYAGEEVAAVAADTPSQAREALRAIAVEYEERPFVLDGEEALKPGAPAVHEPGNVVGPPEVINAHLHDYKVPTALDVPAELTCLPIDPGDAECNTTGTKGLGEPATVPTAPAIANAVYHATGIRLTAAPITPMQLLERLAARRG